MRLRPLRHAPKEAEKATKSKEAETANRHRQSKNNLLLILICLHCMKVILMQHTTTGRLLVKKHGVTSAIDLANAWASLTSKKPEKNQKLSQKSTNNVMVTDAQGQTTNNRKQCA